MPEVLDDVYSPSNILECRRDLVTSLRAGFVGTVVANDAFHVLLEDVKKHLPATVAGTALYESLRVVAGELMTAAALDKLCWRLAGNIPRLSRGEPALPWTLQKYREWVPAQIVRCRWYLTKRKKPGYMFTFRILGGSAAGLYTSTFWGTGFCYFVSKTLGFTARRPSRTTAKPVPYLFRNPREFVNLRLGILLEPEHSKPKAPGFKRIRVPVSMALWNRQQVMAYRDRLDAAHACPFRIPLSVACYRCTKGFESCRAGCHKQDFVKGYCLRCNNHDAYFDNELTSEVCAACASHRPVA
jgi:hypothetical protein